MTPRTQKTTPVALSFGSRAYPRVNRGRKRGFFCRSPFVSFNFCEFFLFFSFSPPLMFISSSFLDVFLTFTNSSAYFLFDADKEEERKQRLFKTVRGRRLGLLARPSLLLDKSPRRRVRRRPPSPLRLQPLQLRRAPPGSPRPSSRSPPWPSRRATRCCARASSGPRRASRAGEFFFPVFCFEGEFFFLECRG